LLEKKTQTELGGDFATKWILSVSGEVFLDSSRRDFRSQPTEGQPAA